MAGAGFGGINAVRTLSRHRSFEITLVDQYSFHVFQPLLYQVALSVLNPEDVIFPVRSLFRSDPNVHFVSASVYGFDPKHGELRTSGGIFAYDYLIVACGSQSALPLDRKWRQNIFTLKTIEDAIRIRERVLQAFEQAETQAEIIKGSNGRSALTTFIVVGGGPTGVELAGELSSLFQNKLKRELKHIQAKDVRVVLLEASDRILPSYPQDVTQYICKSLRRLHVELRTQCRVEDIDSDGVLVNGEFIPAKTVIWTAGVKPCDLNAIMVDEFKATADDKGRIIVEKDLSLKSASNVFLIGDQAYVADRKLGDLPGLAPVAIQEGRHVARQILADHRGLPRQAFVYQDKGQLLVIGGGSAAGRIGGINIFGRPAWFIWALVHLYFLVGVKNRMFVLMSWLYTWLSRNTGSRLMGKTRSGYFEV